MANRDSPRLAAERAARDLMRVAKHFDLNDRELRAIRTVRELLQRITLSVRDHPSAQPAPPEPLHLVDPEDT